MQKLKNLWDTSKKTIILYSLGGFFILLILIISIVILWNLFKKYDYKELENILVNKTEKYLKNNQSAYPTEGNDIIIESDTLIQGKYLKELSKISKDNTCVGNVKVSFQNNTYRFTPNLKCENYHTISLTEQILKTEQIKTHEEGLYNLNESYTYRGEFVNNYINFAGFSWRIFKFDSEKIYLILSDTINTKTMYVFDDRYNETVEQNRGKNNFENSRIYLSLRDIYQKDFKNYHQFIIPTQACINKRSETDQDKSGAIECASTTETYFSLLSIYDYMNASLDPICITATSRNCSNYNYLAKTKNKWWLLNGTDENTYEVYYSDPMGKINLDVAAAKKDIRPVLSLPRDIIYKSGDGTSSNPYTFEEYKKN